jgi:hypothetical protein
MKLGRDLHGALERGNRARIAEQPISIETDHRPFLRLLQLKDGEKEVRGVWVSAGFIDLMNRVAHAQAIDRKAKGYFERYVEMLPSGGVPPLPEGDNARYWSEEVMNEQQSNFNSIVGVVIGMKLAQHYLGYHGGEEITEKEWREAFMHGVGNALRAGCMMEGAAPFFAAIERMKGKPEWVNELIHPKVKFARVRPAMEAAQREYLAGEAGPGVDAGPASN